MRILIRRIHEHPSVARWRLFEGILRGCLEELGHDVFEMDIDFFLPQLPPDPPEAEYRIYAHKTVREAPTVNLFYKEMYMHYLFTVDTEGWGIEHSRMKQRPDLNGIDAVEADRFRRCLSAQLLSTGHSKVVQPAPQPVNACLKPYVLAPMQLPTDYVVRTHAPMGVREYVDTLADWAESRKQNLAFKIHPAREYPELNEAVHRRAAASPYVSVVEGNIHSLICEAEGIIVMNSGTGFESLIHGKPVVTLGNADYQWVTYRARPDDLDSAMQYIAAYSEQSRLEASRFIYYYYTEHSYQIQPDSEAARPRLAAYLKTVVPA